MDLVVRVVKNCLLHKMTTHTIFRGNRDETTDESRTSTTYTRSRACRHLFFLLHSRLYGKDFPTKSNFELFVQVLNSLIDTTCNLAQQPRTRTTSWSQRSATCLSSNCMSILVIFVLETNHICSPQNQRSSSTGPSFDLSRRGKRTFHVQITYSVLNYLTVAINMARQTSVEAAYQKPGEKAKMYDDGE